MLSIPPPFAFSGVVHVPAPCPTSHRVYLAPCRPNKRAVCPKKRSKIRILERFLGHVHRVIAG